MVYICIEIINNVLEDKLEDLMIMIYICCGNYVFLWLFFGGYEFIVEELFLMNYDGFFLEYDFDWVGDFIFLRYWNNKESKVVLGLVIFKFLDLEDMEKIKEWIKEV